jgi:hypothetical protein
MFVVRNMEPGKKILLEVIYKADYCLPCLFMDAAVQEILQQYKDHVEYRRVDIMIGKGRQRFLELSYELFGKDTVHKKIRLAPVPSLLINGELIFDQIPPQFELVIAIEDALSGQTGTS